MKTERRQNFKRIAHNHFYKEILPQRGQFLFYQTREQFEFHNQFHLGMDKSSSIMQQEHSTLIQKDLVELWNDTKWMIQYKMKHNNLNNFSRIGYLLIINGKNEGQARAIKRCIQDNFKSYQEYETLLFFPQKIGNDETIKTFENLINERKYELYITFFVGHTLENYWQDFNHIVIEEKTKKKSFFVIQLREMLERIKKCDLKFFKHFLFIYQACYVGTAQKILEQEYGYLTNIDFIGASKDNIFSKKGIISNFMVDLFGISNVERHFQLHKQSQFEKFWHQSRARTQKGHTQCFDQNGKKYTAKYRPTSRIHHSWVMEKYPAFLMTQDSEQSFQKQVEQVIKKYRSRDDRRYYRQLFDSHKGRLLSEYPQTKKYEYQMLTQQIIVFKPKVISWKVIKGIVISKKSNCMQIYHGQFNYEKLHYRQFNDIQEIFNGCGQYTELFKNNQGLIEMKTKTGNFFDNGLSLGWIVQGYKGSQNGQKIDRVSLKHIKEIGDGNEIKISQFLSQNMHKVIAIEMKSSGFKQKMILNLNFNEDLPVISPDPKLVVPCQQVHQIQKLQKLFRSQKSKNNPTKWACKMRKHYLKSKFQVQQKVYQKVYENERLLYYFPNDVYDKQMGPMKTVFFQWFDPIFEKYQFQVVFTDHCYYWWCKRSYGDSYNDKDFLDLIRM